MVKNIPVEKNKIYKVNITSVASKGEGVGKINDFTVFVPGAMYGEEVEIIIEKVSKTYAIGKLNKIIKISEERTNPMCSLYENCGGCQIQHMNYKGQLDFKKKKVQDAISRIGKMELKVEDVIGMDNPTRYRNKVQLPIGEENGKIKVGFYEPRSHNIIDLSSCYIQDEVADKIIYIVRCWLQKYNIDVYKEKLHRGTIRHIMIRKAFKTGDIMVVIVTNGKDIPHKKELIKDLVSNIKGLKGVIQNINDKQTNVVLGQKSITLWGKDTIVDYIGEFRFNISPLSFFQVNPIQTEVLYNKALEYAGLQGDEVVFDAYCGTGTISLFLSQKCKKVYGVEIIPQAIENAKINAKENNVENVEFIVGKCEDVIPKLIEKGIRADVVIVDPPRKGCEKSLLDAIAKMNPEKIVYVSCDPGTLARDLNILNDMGYITEKVQPVDMFPQTMHVENVAKLCKRK